MEKTFFTGKTFWVLLLLFVCFMRLQGAEDKKVVLVTPSYEPFYGPALKNDGYISAISREVFLRLGYSLEIVYMPWVRAVKMVKEGKYDGVLGAYYKSERKAYFYYSLPLEAVEIVICCKKNLAVSRYDSLRELEKYKIGVVRGYVNEEEFDEADYLSKYESSSSEENLKVFMANRIDMIVDSRKLILFLLRKEYPRQTDQVVFLTPVLRKHYLHIIFSKKVAGSEELTRQFNRVLQQMINDGTVDKIKKEYGW